MQTQVLRRHACSDEGNIKPDTIAECVTGALHHRAAEQANTTAVPFSRRHSVDAEVVGVGKAIKAVLLNIRKTQHFVPFGAVQ